MWSISIVVEVEPAITMGVIPVGRAAIVATRPFRESIVVARGVPVGDVMIDYGGTTERHTVECALFAGSAGCTVRVVTGQTRMGEAPSVQERWLRLDEATRTAIQCAAPPSPGEPVARASA